MPITGQDAATKRILADIGKVRDRVRNMGALLKKIGALGVAESQKAFRESKLGDQVWPVRYPGQPDPFINIAGAVADWNAGRSSPKPSRFDREPPLIDDGMRGGLWGSLSEKSGADFARWGTNKEHARPHQEGLETEQVVTPEGKERMFEWFYSKKSLTGREKIDLGKDLDKARKSVLTAKTRNDRTKAERKVKRIQATLTRGWTSKRKRPKVGMRIREPEPAKEIVWEYRGTPLTGIRMVRVEKIRKTQFIPAGVVGEEMDAARRSDYLKKFGWLLNPKTRNQPTIMVTHVAKRPFVGMTDDLEHNVREAIKRHVEEGK